MQRVECHFFLVQSFEIEIDAAQTIRILVYRVASDEEEHLLGKSALEVRSIYAYSPVQ